MPATPQPQMMPATTTLILSDLVLCPTPRCRAAHDSWPLDRPFETVELGSAELARERRSDAR
jgi:hypothetical protein